MRESDDRIDGVNHSGLGEGWQGDFQKDSQAEAPSVTPLHRCSCLFLQAGEVDQDLNPGKPEDQDKRGQQVFNRVS